MNYKCQTNCLQVSCPVINKETLQLCPLNIRKPFKNVSLEKEYAKYLSNLSDDPSVEDDNYKGEELYERNYVFFLEKLASNYLVTLYNY